MTIETEEPGSERRIHCKPIGFDVETNCRWFADMAAVGTTVLRLSAGRLSRVPWLETKCALAEHLAEDAEHVDAFRKRMTGLRAEPAEIEAATHRAAERLLDLDDCPGPLHFLAAVYLALKPYWIELLRAHADKTDPLADAPSVRMLRRMIDDLRRQVARGRHMIGKVASGSQALAEEAEAAKAWARDWLRGLKRAGGLPGPLVAADSRAFDRKPQFEPLLGERFTVVPESAELPDRRPRNRVEKVWKYMHGRMIGELQCAELFARNLYEFPDAEFEYHLGMARCAWDEARHTLMFLEELERVGGRPGDWPVQFRLYHDVNKGCTPLERAVLFQCFAENSSLDAVSQDRWFFEDQQELVPALHRDYELADEVDHVRFGNRWARRFAHGTDEELWNVVDDLRRRGLLPADHNPELGVRTQSVPAADLMPAADFAPELPVPELVDAESRRPVGLPDRAPVDLHCKQLAECSPRQLAFFVNRSQGRVADTRRSLRVCPK